MNVAPLFWSLFLAHIFPFHAKTLTKGLLWANQVFNLETDIGDNNWVVETILVQLILNLFDIIWIWIQFIMLFFIISVPWFMIINSQQIPIRGTCQCNWWWLQYHVLFTRYYIFMVLVSYYISTRKSLFYTFERVVVIKISLRWHTIYSTNEISNN